MAEFYVTFDLHEERYLAIIVAPERPASLQFSSRDEVIEAMEALGKEWLLQSEIQLPDDSPAISTAWLERMAEAGRLKQLPKSRGSLLGSAGAEAAPTD